MSSAAMLLHLYRGIRLLPDCSVAEQPTIEGTSFARHASERGHGTVEGVPDNKLDEVPNALRWRLGRSNSAILPKAGNPETQKIASSSQLTKPVTVSGRLLSHPAESCLADDAVKFFSYPLAGRPIYPFLRDQVCTGTIAFPIGHSASPASFRCAQANGMPTMVTASKIAVTRWPSANHHPAKTSHTTLPITPSGPVPTSSRPKYSSRRAVRPCNRMAAAYRRRCQTRLLPRASRQW